MGDRPGQYHGGRAGQCYRGQCYGDKGRQCYCHVLRGGTNSRGVTPVPILWKPTRGTPPVTSAYERGGGGAGGAAFPSAGAGGREGGSGWIDGLGRGAEGVGVGDRREGNASWVELSESCSDLQPGGRCCRRERQRLPTPPGSRVPV